MSKGHPQARALTLAMIRGRCNEIGECWEWAQGMRPGGRPCVGELGKVVSPRRRAFELDRGVTADSDMAVVDTCGSKSCCSPKHLKLIPRGDVPKHMAEQGKFKSAVGRANKTKARRERSEMSMTKAREIRRRFADGEPLKEIAPDYPVRPEHVRRVALGQAWKETVTASSIFSMGGKVLEPA